ncbi:MAG TPA: aminotransferase class I/II-fold pyridoxal phosphate-dependent enzyme [Acidimicrobiia bacterium]
MTEDQRNGESLPETEMMTLGWDPTDGLGSLKTPLFQTSTFSFETAEGAQRAFEVTYGGAVPGPDEEIGYIYTRLDHPNLVVVESRLAAWDQAERALLFSSGMSAIFTTLLTLLRPGDLILHSSPLYGGTNSLFEHVLAPMGIEATSFGPDATEDELDALVAGRSLAVVYVESPANPTNDIFDIGMAAAVASRHSARTMVDNTYLGPIGQQPHVHGADLVVYSATKYYGGHSDLIAGVVTGPDSLIRPIKTMRYRIGTHADPHTAWLLGRSLETYALRSQRQVENASRVATFLAGHSKVARVGYLGLIGEADPRRAIFDRQCTSSGAMITFEVKGGREEAFRFLNTMKLVGLATSLGGTESIASHPATTSHSNVDPVTRDRMGVTEAMIRFSIGIEAADDIIADLEQALAAV